MSEPTSDQASPSPEAEESVAAAGASRREQVRELASRVSVFDAMLLVSLFCIVLATGILFRELTSYATFPAYPWRTDEAIVDPPPEF